MRSVAAAAISRMKYQARPSLMRGAAELRRVNDNAGREAAPRFVFAAGVDHDEMQRERAHGQIKPAQPQRWQPEDNPKQSAHETRRRERHPERRVELTNRMPAVNAPAAISPAWPSEI